MRSASTSFNDLIETMTQAICAGDGAKAAACFAEHGVYHDGFYGEFKGRAAIVDLVQNHFHRDARELAWRIFDVCADAKRAYAKYDFSYTSKLEGSAGIRIAFSGMLCCELEGGLIRHYEEIFERALVLVALKFPDERILKTIRRWTGQAKSN